MSEDKDNQISLIDEVQDRPEAEPAKNVRKKAREKARVAPRLFFRKDERIEVQVNGYHSTDTGELMFVIPVTDGEKSDDFGSLFTEVNYRFQFTRVPYDKLNRYRTRSMIYNSEDQNNTINTLLLREYFLVFHLVDWNLTDEDGKKIELKFDPNGALSDESLSLIYSLPPSLVDTVLATFEKKMSL